MNAGSTSIDLDEPIFRHVRRDITPLLVGQTVGDALRALRTRQLGERLVYFYVTDSTGILVGVVPIRRLLMSDPDIAIEALMVTSVASLPSTATVRDAAQQLLDRRLLALPIVDTQGRLHRVADIGMVSGEVLANVETQSANDAFEMVGARVSMSGSVWTGFTNRFPWLICNVIGGLIAAFVASRYEALLNSVIVLALFMPVVLALSKSIGIHAATLTLQHLHGVGVSWGSVVSSLRRGAMTAALLRLGCGALVGAVACVFFGSLRVAIIVAATISSGMIASAAVGATLPSALRKWKRDPRIASGPIVLAIVDFGTLVVYFNRAAFALARRP